MVLKKPFFVLGFCCAFLLIFILSARPSYGQQDQIDGQWCVDCYSYFLIVKLCLEQVTDYELAKKIHAKKELMKKAGATIYSGESFLILTNAKTDMMMAKTNNSCANLSILSESYRELCFLLADFLEMIEKK